MGLAGRKRLFFSMRGTCEIIVRKHAFEDYPERGFSQREIISLIRKGVGHFTENSSSQAIDGSYLFFPRDELGRECKLVILIEEVEVEGMATTGGDLVIVCSAYREAAK